MRRFISVLIVIAILLTVLPAGVVAADVALPASLDAFLNNVEFAFLSAEYRTYYCTYPTQWDNILSLIVQHPSCADFSAYPVVQPVYNGAMDPYGWWGAYMAYDVEAVKWVAQNIFHLSGADYDTLVTDAFYN